jgi:alginate O-acetyltransferase complex protein AlgI
LGELFSSRWVFSQKVVLADTLLSGTSDTVFGSDKTLHFWDAWAGTLAFSGQIFFDFAGYSTCAIGVAMMMGIMLPHNFYIRMELLASRISGADGILPYPRGCGDYLYIPLGGNRFGIARMYAALMITMLLGGLWHGAAWTFVFWGLLHGVFLVAERLIRPYFRVHASAWYAVIFAFMTFTAVNFSWVFFRAREFDTASSLIQSMLFLQSNGEKILGEFELIKVMLISAGLFLTHWFMRHYTVKMIASGINTFLSASYGRCFFFHSDIPGQRGAIHLFSILTSKAQISEKHQNTHVFIFLSILVFITSVLTYIVPSGQYDRTIKVVNPR